MKNRLSDKKGYLQISFGWLFAIIVGIFIIGLAIYGSFTFIGTEQEFSSAEAGKEIEILTNVLETGLESSKTTSFDMPLETRIRNNCDGKGEFGNQGLQLAQKSFDKWSEVGVEIKFENRYLFSEKIVEGKDFYLFSKPFDFPFKVSDVIYLTSSKKNYCFSDAPEDIKREIENLNQGNLLTEDCSSANVQVCFDGFGSEGSCDVNVNLNQKYVEKEEDGITKKVYFETNALMYGAIFSGKENYECQVKRIMKRLVKLSEIYAQKEVNLFEKQSCPGGVRPLDLANSARIVGNSEDLIQVKKTSDEIDVKNNGAVCKLW